MEGEEIRRITHARRSRIVQAKQSPVGAKCNSDSRRRLGAPPDWRAPLQIGRNSRFFQSGGGRRTPSRLSAEPLQIGTGRGERSEGLRTARHFSRPHQVSSLGPSINRLTAMPARRAARVDRGNRQENPPLKATTEAPQPPQILRIK